MSLLQTAAKRRVKRDETTVKRCLSGQRQGAYVTVRLSRGEENTLAALQFAGAFPVVFHLFDGCLRAV